MSSNTFPITNSRESLGLLKASVSALRDINFCLENIYRCQNEEVRNHYEGLARFFRAYFYFVKVRRFGDVPWYDYVIGSADTEALSKPSKLESVSGIVRCPLIAFSKIG